MSEPAHIAKMDAARRQLSEAIWLFFEGRDPLCVLALAGPARRVLIDLAEREGIRTIRDVLRDVVKEGHVSEAEKFVNHAQNFIKHADKDPEATLDPKQVDAQSIVFEGCVSYLAVAKEWLVEIAAFLAWMQLEHPDIFKQNLVNAPNLQEAKGDKSYFLGFLRRAEAAQSSTKLGRKAPDLEES